MKQVFVVGNDSRGILKDREANPIELSLVLDYSGRKINVYTPSAKVVLRDQTPELGKVSGESSSGFKKSTSF